VPNTGPDVRGQPELVPDWMLGGAGRRRILKRLAEDGDGWTGRALQEDLGLGHAWVFEVLRALRSTKAVERVPGTRGSYRLSDTDPLGKSLRAMLDALEPYAKTAVSRPPSRRSASPS
jgi:DNA-binding HxlR family transcriptional regulator